MQDYIDAQFGGPGKGFYRIVTNPFQARKVINAGKMAVVMGIETSVPFGCTFKACPAATCPRLRRRRRSTAQLDEVHRLGRAPDGAGQQVRQRARRRRRRQRRDRGAVNTANFLETGSFWDMRHCDAGDGEAHDQQPAARRPEIIAPSSRTRSSARSRKLFDAGQPAGAAVYPPARPLQRRGLTTLGEHTIDGLAEQHMSSTPTT